MEITAIRHLPTEWNLKKQLQGRRDIPILPISEKENEQIIENLRFLANQSFDHVLCSTLQRTKQTALYFGFDAHIEPLLNELDFGPFEGRTKTELLTETANKWIDEPLDLVLGESLNHFQDRIIHFLEKYKHSSQILIFGHGSWIRALASYNKYGHINRMNHVTIKNNELHTFEFLTVEV